MNINNIKVTDPEEVSTRLSCIGSMQVLNLEDLVDPWHFRTAREKDFIYYAHTQD